MTRPTSLFLLAAAAAALFACSSDSADDAGASVPAAVSEATAGTAAAPDDTPASTTPADPETDGELEAGSCLDDSRINPAEVPCSSARAAYTVLLVSPADPLGSSCPAETTATLDATRGNVPITYCLGLA